MFFRRYGTFAGGIDLPEEKQATLNQAIKPWAISGPLRLPVSFCEDSAQWCVKVGQTVALGDRISQGKDTAVYSPVAGEITAFSQGSVISGDTCRPVPVVEIQSEGRVMEYPALGGNMEWRMIGAEKLRNQIAAGRLTIFERPARPLMHWIDLARRNRCLILVANVLENQPYLTADHRLLAEHGEEVLGGLLILRQAIEAEEAILAVASYRVNDYQSIVDTARKYNITRVALPHKYPMGSPAILTKVLTRREIPPGGSTMDVGVAMIDAATCAAVYHWVVAGIPPMGRVVTVSGPEAETPGNYFLPFGVLCRNLTPLEGLNHLHDNPMTGVRCNEDTVVSPTTRGVLAFGDLRQISPSPCIRCSWCTDHCPARLNVAAINDAFELRNIKQVGKLLVSACVECGVCSYVCPARLPLSQRVRQLKRGLTRSEPALPLFSGEGR